MKTIAPMRLTLSKHTLRKLSVQSGIRTGRPMGSGGGGSATIDQDLKCMPGTPSAGCQSDGCHSAAGTC